MFRHTGIRRTFKHNIRLAGLLSLTAGFVNVVGVLAFFALTTNITGHVAYFAEKLTLGDYHGVKTIGLWILMFFSGAFFSSIFIGITGRNVRYAYTIPFLIEALILIIIGTFSYVSDNSSRNDLFIGLLLFAMGLQNAMVSMISGFIVRTTHLTGMFTDLGIELAELVQKRYSEKSFLKQKIQLRFVIIFFFFLGGICGGMLYRIFLYKTFYFPALILFFAMFYDFFRISVLKYMRKIKRKSSY